MDCFAIAQSKNIEDPCLMHGRLSDILHRSISKSWQQFLQYLSRNWPLLTHTPHPLVHATTHHPHFFDSFQTDLPAFPLALVYSQPRSQNKPFKHKSDHPTPLFQTFYTVEYYSATKREMLLFGTTLVDLEAIMLSERSQTKKSKYCMISLVRRIWESWPHRNKK